jgi:hypothetical protein
MSSDYVITVSTQEDRAGNLLHARWSVSRQSDDQPRKPGLPLWLEPVGNGEAATGDEARDEAHKLIDSLETKER